MKTIGKTILVVITTIFTLIFILALFGAIGQRAIDKQNEPTAQQIYEKREAKKAMEGKNYY